MNVPFVYIDFHILPPFPLAYVCCVSILYQHLEPSIQAASESNLESFFYEAVYDAASTIDYSKEPIDAGVVDSPPPKQIFRHSPSPSPLKGVKRDCHGSPASRPQGGNAPQRRLRMDALTLPVPLRDASPVRSGSGASVPRVKVRCNLRTNASLRMYICIIYVRNMFGSSSSN